MLLVVVGNSNKKTKPGGKNGKNKNRKNKTKIKIKTKRKSHGRLEHSSDFVRFLFFEQDDNVEFLPAARIRNRGRAGKSVDGRNLLIAQRLMVITEHINKTADEIRPQKRLKRLLFRLTLCIPSKDALSVRLLARLEQRRHSRLDRAPALDIAPDKGPELAHVVRVVAHELAVAAGVRGEHFVLLERDVGGPRAGARRVEVVGREAVFADDDAVLVEELGARDDAMVADRGGLGLGEDSAGGVFVPAHIEREEGEWIDEVRVGGGVELEVFIRISDFVVLSQRRDFYVFCVFFESVLEYSVGFSSFDYKSIVIFGVSNEWKLALAVMTG